MLPKKDPNYEPSDCMMLFAPYASKFSNGKWIVNQFTKYRNGEGVSYNGQVPCSQGASAWTVNPGSGYPYVFICNSFETLTVDQAATKIIHEALHTAGLGENPPTPGEIDQAVRQNCGL